MTHTQPARIPSATDTAAMHVRTAQNLDALGDALGALGESTAARRNLDLATSQYVRDAKSNGATWQQIADALGVSRQSAHALYSPSIRR